MFRREGELRQRFAISYAKRGDPYATHVKRTTAGLIKRLGWPRDRWTQTFQSLFGRPPTICHAPVASLGSWPMPFRKRMGAQK